jgi:Ca2+-binding RTX toxin-like protein
MATSPFFSDLTNFTVPDFGHSFNFNDVLNLANNWNVSVPNLFDAVSFTQKELNDTFQNVVSDLTGIQIASPYTLNTLIPDLENLVNNVTPVLTTTDLASVNYSGDSTIDALLDNSVNWNYLNSARTVLYYSFDIKNFDDSELDTAIEAFSSDQQKAARAILNYAASVTGIKFEEVATTQDADLHFANADLDGKRTAGLCNNSYSYHFNSKNAITEYSADAYIYLDNVEWVKINATPTKGAQGYETLLHEVGHALGLKHSFESPKALPAAQDNTDNTVMSYTHKGEYKTEFQSYDLAALKWIYGGDGLGGISNSSVTIAKLSQGTAGNDNLIGTSNADKLDGLAGNDILDGRVGRDTLTGGDGNDVYIVDNIGDQIIETNKTDNDSVQSSVNFTLPKNVENLALTGKAIIGTGNELANQLVGNAFANALNGMAGNDTLEGGKGNDKLTGGLGEDTFIFNLLDYDFKGDFAPRAQNLDTITDFTKGTDSLNLSAAFAFKGFVSVANLKQSVGDASLIYDNASRALYFDADGAETHYTPTKFIQFSGRVNLDTSDLKFIDESNI